MNRFDDEQPGKPSGAAVGSSSRGEQVGASQSPFESFGFDLSDDDWMVRIRRAESPTDLGRIGDYELIEEISRGAQGIVYRARQPNTHREIAIKRLAAGRFATPEMRARFVREIETAASLSHPNVVRVYGTDIVGDQPVLAMEWIAGIPVDRWACDTRDGAKSVPEILRVFAAICDAVHYAHQRGVIHRDLKPSNILVDANGQPHVLDFGLAKLTVVDDSAAVHLTRTKDFVGTPAYASPEQVRGDSRTIDVRSDVYALGVLLYQMLTGRLPYPDDRNLAELLLAIKEYDPPPPSQSNTRLNREIDAIVLKALAKAPDRRYASVDGLASDVRRYLSNEPVLAHPPTTLYQLRKVIGRHQLAFGLSAALAAVLVVFGVVTAVMSFRLREERESAVAAQQKEARARQIAEQVNAFMRDMFTASEPDRARGREVTAREVLDRSAEQIDARNEMAPEVEASIRGSIGRSYYGLGLYESAQRHLELAVQLACDAYGKRHEDVAGHMELLSYVYRQEGRFEEARSLLEDVYAIRTAVLEDGHESIATCLQNLASLAMECNDLAAAEAPLQQAIDMLTTLHGEDDRRTLAAQVDLASLYHHRGLHSESTELLHALLPRVREAFGQKHNRTLQALNNLAVGLKNLRRYDEAQIYYEELLETARDMFGAEHPNTINFIGNLGSLHQAKGELDTAEVLLRQAFDRARSVMGETNPTTLAITNNFAALMMARNEVDEAIELFRFALAGQRDRFGEQHPGTAVIMGGLGAVLLRKEDASSHHSEASLLMNGALNVFESVFPRDHPYRRKTLEGLLLLYGPEHMNDAEAAERIQTELDLLSID